MPVLASIKSLECEQILKVLFMETHIILISAVGVLRQGQVYEAIVESIESNFKYSYIWNYALLSS